MKNLDLVAVRSASQFITPGAPAVLGANGLPQQQVSNVADELEANVLVLGDNSDPIVMVTCDLLYVGEALKRAVVDTLAKQISSDRLFMAASHTHRAPITDSTKPGLGSPSLAIIQEIADCIVVAIRTALAQPAVLCRVEVGYGRHSAGINRRLRRLASISRSGIKFRPTLLAPNASGPVDNKVRRLRFTDSSTGVSVAEVWSTALHPTGYPERAVISADFPGYVRRAIREVNGEPIPVLFLQGFSGNIRPATPSTPWGLKRLLVGPGFVGFTDGEYQSWVEALAKDVLNVNWKCLQGSGVSSIRNPIKREVFLRGGGPPHEGHLHGLRIGNLAIVGVPSEVVVEYSSSLTRVRPLEDVWGVGCIDHVWGYSPTSDMLSEGGYEVDSFCTAFGVEGVNPQVEPELRSRIESLIQCLAQT